MNPLQLMQMLTQIKSNPMAILSQFGIPANIASDPQSVIQHLMNNGQISQSQYDNAVKQAQGMGYKF